MSARREGAGTPVIAIGAVLIAWLSFALCAGVLATLALGIARAFLTQRTASSHTFTNDLALFPRTILISIVIAGLAAALAFPAAWSMRRLSLRWSALLAAPLFLPSYLVYASWSLLRAPGTWLGDRLEGGSAPTWTFVNHAQAITGLALWSWPLAAIFMAGAARSIDQSLLDLLRLSGAPSWRRGLTILAMMRRGVLAGAALVAVVMLGSAVPLHLAGIDTLSLIIWRRMNEGAPPAAIWTSALPLLAIALLAGWMLTSKLLAPRVIDPATHVRDPAVSPGCIALAAALWGVSILVPLGLFAANLRSSAPLRTFWSFGAEPLGQGVHTAAITGGLCTLITAGTALAFNAPRVSFTHLAARASLRLWLITALTPGLLIGAAALSASTVPELSFLAETRAGVVLAHVARFGAVGALAGWWLHASEPSALSDLRRIFAGERLSGWFRTVGVVQLPAIIGAGLACALLSLHEIEAAVVIAAPDAAGLARHMLALLHYLRDDQLSAGVVYLCGGGLIVSLLCTIPVARAASMLRSAAAPCVAACLLLAIIGCDRPAPPGQPRPVPTSLVIGEPGQGEGQFVTPRCIDAGEGSLWVIDKTARVQRFSPTGEFQGAFTMPAFAKGMPTGVTRGPDGLLYIADTHEHRVLVCRAEKDNSLQRTQRRELESDKDDAEVECRVSALTPIYSSSSVPSVFSVVNCLGAYGEGPGQFIYPTDVAILAGPDGATADRFYVSEYGGNDRISVFDPQNRFLFSFGEPGSAADDPVDVRFARPQSIVIDRDNGEIIVADAANHRLGRFTLDGQLIAWIGRGHGAGLAGRALGEFAYPYGLALVGPRRVLVAEYGNNRVQLVDFEAGFSALGEPGRAAGQLVTPWGVAVLDDQVYILDTGNHRVQMFPLHMFGRPELQSVSATSTSSGWPAP